MSEPQRMSAEFRRRMRAGVAEMAVQERLRERRRGRALLSGAAAVLVVAIAAVAGAQVLGGLSQQDLAAPPPPPPLPSVTDVRDTSTPTPTPSATITPAPSETPDPTTITPPISTAPTEPPRVIELPTGGPAPSAGQSYDLAIVCDPAIPMWIDNGAAPDAGSASWRSLSCDGVAAFIDFGVPAADARVFALIEDGQPMPTVQRRLTGGSFTAEQDAALVASADGVLVSATVWCGTTAGTVAIGARSEECTPNGAAVFDDVPLAEALTGLTGPPGYDVWVLLMRP